jgi:poly(3-hydroxybutyrate) depolymerase
MASNVSYLTSKGTSRSGRLAGLLLVLFGLGVAQPAAAAKVEFRFSAWDGPEVRVYASRPLDLASDRPVVFVMHGMKRNAREYRDQWHQLAVDNDFLLVVPEFDERQFPGPAAYDLGGVFDASGARRMPEQWSFALIEPLFDDVRKRFSMTTTHYSLYGHSAGAQFVERFLLYVPGARVSRAVAANAGWYTMPEFDQAWPYGLERSGVSEQALARMLQFPLTILLGEEDMDTDDPRLRMTPEALLQGRSRLERGSQFLETGRKAAARLGIPFGWRLQTVEGADHDNRLMAPAAVEYLIP